MRRLVAWTLTLILLVLPLRAFALHYSDDENLLTVDVPENGSTLCYTEEQAHLPEDMQSAAERNGLDARLLVRSYTPEDLLGYTLDVVVCPLSSLGTAAAPEPTGNPVRYTDITASGVREQALELVREMYSGRFTLGAARDGSFHGVPDLELSGSGNRASHWADYDCSAYLLTNSERLVIITAVYLPAEEEAVNTLLAGISLDGSPAAPSPSKTASASPRPPAEAARTQAASLAPAASPASDPGWTAAVLEFWHQHPNLPYYALLAAAVIVLAVGLIIYLRAARERRWTIEDDGDARLLPSGPAGRSRRNRHAIKEDKMGVSERPSRTGRPEYDYADDISRYTQQPSADVNDVSRYTHGYDEADSLSAELSKALQDEPQAPPVRIQSVGSRVERNRRKKRR